MIDLTLHIAYQIQHRLPVSILGLSTTTALFLGVRHLCVLANLKIMYVSLMEAVTDNVLWNILIPVALYNERLKIMGD